MLLCPFTIYETETHLCLSEEASILKEVAASHPGAVWTRAILHCRRHLLLQSFAGSCPGLHH
ncbi:hypothetical protein LEMLEM_LOCUS2782 [Lemmus lemmus]